MVHCPGEGQGKEQVSLRFQKVLRLLHELHGKAARYGPDVGNPARYAAHLRLATGYCRGVPIQNCEMDGRFPGCRRRSLRASPSGRFEYQQTPRGPNKAASRKKDRAACPC